MELFENVQAPERALLVGVNTGAFDADASIDELAELASSAGAEVFGFMMQKRERPNTATYVGSGRLEEIRESCEQNDIDLLIFDTELSPSQKRNIENHCAVRVIDRTTLILDIFAARANSKEGKIQVELAQLRYQLPRLGGQGKNLSRLGGGIGTRGPGETKLESDRRHIHRRIDALEKELKAIEKHRDQLRKRRKKDGIESVAIVGYTNAGKSTLMNALTDAGVLAEDKLFATLDPTARALTLPDGRSIMLVDTVGLVRRLPHHLVQAFRSTLEEAAQADLILNVCDASSDECAEHLKVTEELLHSLGCEKIPVISVLNKCDLMPDLYGLPTLGQTVMISAETGDGLSNLLFAISASLPPTRRRVLLLFPFEKVGIAAQIRKDGVIHAEEYTERGLRLDATVDIKLLDIIKDYILEL